MKAAFIKKISSNRDSYSGDLVFLRRNWNLVMLCDGLLAAFRFRGDADIFEWMFFIFLID